MLLLYSCKCGMEASGLFLFVLAERNSHEAFCQGVKEGRGSCGRGHALAGDLEVGGLVRE